MEAPYEIWLTGQAGFEEIFKEEWMTDRQTTEAYLSYKLTSEPLAQVS